MQAIDSVVTDDWTLIHGDCCRVLEQMPDECIDFGIHSPPFSNLYIYSDSDSDMGNCASNEEFIEHYGFAIKEMFRATVSGRCCAVHCKDLPKYANRDDTAGLIDFPGMIIREYERHGWSFHSRVTIWKCPVTERERTNNNGLLHKTVLRDRSQLRQGMADYLLVFRRPPVGELMSVKPVAPREGFIEYVGDALVDPRSSEFHPSPYSRNKHATEGSIDIWRRYAEPVWWDVGTDPIVARAYIDLRSVGWSDCDARSALGMDLTDAIWFDIDQMDVLNYKQARGERDERHICPLQLGLIERAVSIWSDYGDVVFSPFAGIGSEGVASLRRGRKFLGVELKSEYFDKAKANLSREVRKLQEKPQPSLNLTFDE